MLGKSKSHGKFATLAKIWGNTRANDSRTFVKIKSKLEIKSSWGVYSDGHNIQQVLPLLQCKESPEEALTCTAGGGL